MAKKPERHPMTYRTRELLLNKLERAVHVSDGAAQLLGSFHGQLARFKTRINMGEALDPAEVDRFGKHFKHEAGVLLQALSALHGAMKVAYPNGKVLWLQDAPAPWDPPGAEYVTHCAPEFEDEARAEGLLPPKDEEEKEKRPA